MAKLGIVELLITIATMLLAVLPLVLVVVVVVFAIKRWSKKSGKSRRDKEVDKSIIDDL